MKLIRRSTVKSIWQKLILNVFIIVAVFGMSMPIASANSAVNEVRVSLGNDAGELKFFPSNIEKAAIYSNRRALTIVNNVAMISLVWGKPIVLKIAGIKKRSTNV